MNDMGLKDLLGDDVAGIVGQIRPGSGLFLRTAKVRGGRRKNIGETGLVL
jgi:hypothetical protein